MRVLFDENVDWRLKRFFGERFEVATVRERGWGSKENGELLDLAQEEFDILLTTDKGIPHQQNLSTFDLAVVLVRAGSNAYEHLEPLMDEVLTAMDSISPGTIVRVPAEPL